MSTHEQISRSETIPLPSNRSFGLVFTVVFALIGLFPLIKGNPIRAWALIVAAVFLVLALLNSKVLTPLNWVWMRFGLLLHHIVSPIVLGVVFFLAVLPVALIARAKGKDPLKRTFDPSLQSYWIVRDPGPEPETMRNQF